MNKVPMAAFASSIHKASGLKIGYQLTDLWQHVYGVFMKFAERSASGAGWAGAGRAFLARAVTAQTGTWTR